MSAPGQGEILVGTAGWQIPRVWAHRFAVDGSHLSRYARGLPCVEINSSFHRPHAFATYARWAASTPPGFRFAIKLPRAITHKQRLLHSDALLERFLEESGGLGEKRGPILIQLPPSLAFVASGALPFFDNLRTLYGGQLVLEPRHASWMTGDVNALLTAREVARVGADPPRAPGAHIPGGWGGIVYFRLHGSPRTYWSRYSTDDLQGIAGALQRAAATAAVVWCVFDNTAAGGAIDNGLELQAALSSS